MTSDPIAFALLAVMASHTADVAAAQGHLATAQRLSRATARRERQVVEIAALVVAGQGQRAADLALVHAVEFPDDSELLARVTATQR
jgi:alcohol dehydrogenase class IV